MDVGRLIKSRPNQILLSTTSWFFSLWIHTDQYFLLSRPFAVDFNQSTWFLVGWSGLDQTRSSYRPHLDFFPFESTSTNTYFFPDHSLSILIDRLDFSVYHALSYFAPLSIFLCYLLFVNIFKNQANFWKLKK